MLWQKAAIPSFHRVLQALTAFQAQSSFPKRVNNKNLLLFCLKSSLFTSKTLLFISSNLLIAR